MPFAKMTEGGNFTPAPAGTHGARLLIATDLGTQDTPFGIKRQARLTWALPDELMDDGRPYSIPIPMDSFVQMSRYPLNGPILISRIRKRGC